jgi:CMP-N,N'-diacetyllegionaminic acid synthase|tara:strand:- start:1272 stop:1997 length:726 start_codon:yes stop_codon:yes gene_type:complete
VLKKKYKLIALIPARQGSERIKNKNIIKLFNLPLLAHTIVAAKKSKIFDKIILSTDSKKYSYIGSKFGAETPFLRPKILSKSTSPDFDWVKYTLDRLIKTGSDFTHFFILRPTNPFRTHKTILRAWQKFKKIKNADSLRAVEICKQHPGKMWTHSGNFIYPLLSKKKKSQPYYNMQFKSLPKILVQNGSLEISKISVIKKNKTITGKKIIPFLTSSEEGFDINYPIDIALAKHYKRKKSWP